MEAEWVEMAERLEAASKELTDARAENVELKERLLETENRRKAIELESDERIKTLTEQLSAVVAEKTELDDHLKNSPKQPETSEAEDEGGSEIKGWRRKFWEQLCDYAAQKDTPIRFNKPSSENYLNVSRSLIDLTGFRMNVWLGKNNRKIAIRLYMSKQNFDLLEEQKKKLSRSFVNLLNGRNHLSVKRRAGFSYVRISLIQQMNQTGKTSTNGLSQNLKNSIKNSMKSFYRESSPQVLRSLQNLSGNSDTPVQLLPFEILPRFRKQKRRLRESSI